MALVNYEDLSRRGLIKLCEDFDSENDGDLLYYLNTTLHEYEKIRPSEQKTVERDKRREAIRTAPENFANAVSNPKVQASVLGEFFKLFSF